MTEQAKEPRLRCRASVWGPPREMRSYQCLYASKPGQLRDLRGSANRVERLPVCGIHARMADVQAPHLIGAYFWNGSRYENPVAEHVREHSR